MTRLCRPVIASIAAVALAAAASTTGASSAAQTGPLAEAQTYVAAVPQSPPEQVLVLNLNAAELFGAKDREKTLDLGNFAQRLKSLVSSEVVRYEPDVIIVSEVLASTAKNLVRKLNQYGPGGNVSNPPNNYVLDVAPAEKFPRVAGVGDSKPRIVRTNAIILNNRTMKRQSDVEYVSLKYPESARAYIKDAQGEATKEKYEWVTKEVPFRRYREKVATGAPSMAIAAISSHMRPSARITNPETWHNEMIKQKINFIDEATPNRGPVPVIAGDMNNRLCEQDLASTNPNCKATPMWKSLMAADYNTAIPSFIDHIFTRGRIVSQGVDEDTEALVGGRAAMTGKCTTEFGEGKEPAQISKDCREHYYSDHVFVWAVIAEK